MGLKQTLLGQIALMGPQSGYSLHKNIHAPGRPVIAQVYQALQVMKKSKQVEFNRVFAEKRPSRNIIRLTPAGYEELKTWLDKHEFVQPVREPLMQQIWFGNIVGTDKLIASLKLFIKKRKYELKYYRDEKKRIINELTANKIADISNKLYWSVVFDYTTDRCKADIEWAKATIKLLSLESKPAKAGKTGRKTKVNNK